MWCRKHGKIITKKMSNSIENFKSELQNFKNNRCNFSNTEILTELQKLQSNYPNYVQGGTLNHLIVKFTLRFGGLTEFIELINPTLDVVEFDNLDEAKKIILGDKIKNSKISESCYNLISSTVAIRFSDHAMKNHYCLISVNGQPVVGLDKKKKPITGNALPAIRMTRDIRYVEFNGKIICADMGIIAVNTACISA